MKRYICTICGYVYDETKGDPDHGVPAGTRWEDLPDSWVCAFCGAPKSEFREDAPEVQEAAQEPTSETRTDMRELSALEMSVLCSNLARGCEKQYKSEEAALFTQLSDAFLANAKPAEEPSYAELLHLVQRDLDDDLPAANAIAADPKDRGALRVLTWCEKVTRILRSLLNRYEKAGDAMLENTGVYVCTICGFVYVGDTPPALCPVCKVPSWKFEKIERRAV